MSPETYATINNWLLVIGIPMIVVILVVTLWLHRKGKL